MTTSGSGSAPVLTFLGAAGTVTGSRFLIDTTRARVLVDCGLFQGLKPLRLRNWDVFPVAPASIDSVVLTHAHVDHVGYLPRLRSDGFAGPAFATPGTVALAGIVLPDCGHLQEEEADYANRKGFSKHDPALPLFTEQDAIEALDLLRPVEFGSETEVAPGVHATFRPAGHILGSATISIRLADHDDRVVLFSGDLGRPHHPVLTSPTPPGAPDVMVVESTYGDRRHDDADSLERFAQVITSTVGRGGTVLIPAFAVDRTEVVLFHLRELVEQHRIPDVPIYVDSPMALAALRAYERAIRDGAEDLDPAVLETAAPFDGGRVVELHDVEDSKALASNRFPSIIVSASGMATGGRVVHHLARLLPDRRNSVVLVGHQAAGTRGRLLVDGATELKMLGRYVRVRAEVVDLAAFSIHADQGELLDWIGSVDRPADVVYLVHGEPAAAATFHDLVEDRLDWSCVVPHHGERVRLDR